MSLNEVLLEHQRHTFKLRYHMINHSVGAIDSDKTITLHYRQMHEYLMR